MRRTALLLCALAITVGLLPTRRAGAQDTVAERFLTYYARYQGARVLGPPISGLTEVEGVSAQYFEKARLEDHREELGDSPWGLMFGRLTAELMERAPQAQVSGTRATYGQLAERHRADTRVAPPPDFRGGTAVTPGGIFVPYDPQLRPASGYLVPMPLWRYMTRADLFPRGWLHAFGLPMAPALETTTVKGGQERTITMQAFERAVLTYDPRNPAAWQVERANVGQDALQAYGLPQPAPGIELPLPREVVTLPLHIQARAGQPGTDVTAVVRWADGVELSGVLPVLPSQSAGEPGWVIGSLTWLTEGPPPRPVTPEATLELRTMGGQVLARQAVTVLSHDAPGTRAVDVYYLIGEELVAQRRTVPDTPAIATAALRELLWPPVPGNLAGFTTAIPTPEEVLAYPGREAGWGPRVQLLSLTIDDGVATVDVSPEIRAYGGGSARAQAIRDQVTRTLLQFPTVRTVRIAVAGQTEGVLQP